MAADPHGTHEPPPTPAPDGRYDERIAWWAPLLHLTAYGLGWAHPIRGLARDQAGRPTDEPIFAAVQRWWGRCLDDVLAWGADWAPGNIEGPNLTPNRNITFDRGTLFQQYWPRRSDPGWIQRWGSGDPLHLWLHARTAASGCEDLTSSTFASNLSRPAHPAVAARIHHITGKSPVTQVLILDDYLGWYTALLHTADQEELPATTVESTSSSSHSAGSAPTTLPADWPVVPMSPQDSRTRQSVTGLRLTSR